jgi:hypothetical protein
VTSDPTRPSGTELPLAVLDQIDRICDRFERTWESGIRPRIEDYFGEVAEEYRVALLRDLVAAELDAIHLGTRNATTDAVGP